MVDAFIILTPILLLGVIALLGFVGCGTLIGVEDVTYAPVEATNTALSSSKNPSLVGDAVTFKANVTASNGTPQGNIDLKEGINLLVPTQVLDASGNVSFPAVTFSAAGAHVIHAVYAGSASNFYPSLSPDLTQTVNVAPPPPPPPPATVTIGQPPQTKQQPGNPPIAVTLSATKKGGLIVVTVSWGLAGTISISDGSNVYQSAGNGNWSGQQAQTFYAVNTVGGNLTITASGPGTTGSCRMCASEYLNTAAALPVYSFAAKGSPSTGGALNVTVNPANVGDMIYAVAFAQNGNLNVGSGFTSETSSTLGTFSLAVADKSVAAAGATAVGIANAVATSPWVILALAIKHG